MKTAIRLSLVALSVSLMTAACSEKTTEAPGTAMYSGTLNPLSSEPTKKTTEEANRENIKLLNSITSIAELCKRKSIPNSTVICTVGGDAVSVSDYKHSLKVKQDQISQALQANPEQRIPILKHADEDHIELTPEERKTLIAQAKSAVGKDLAQRLKESNTTEAQFEQDVAEMGRALKTASRAAEKKLIHELISAALLVDAARNAGLAKTAFNRYIEFKHSPAYDTVAGRSDLTPDQLRDKIIEEFLVQAMQTRIIESANLPDSKVMELYNEQKNSFKHNGRVKWSQIVVAAPDQDMGPVESVRSQVHRQFPELTGQAFEDKVKQTEEQQHQKALDILKRVNNGENFEELANQVTDDLPARATKKGGDMGYINVDEILKNELLKQVGNSLQKMKVGEVSQEPVKTPFGWHIIKKTGEQKSGFIPFAEVKDELRQQLAEQQSNMAMMAWLIEKRKTVPIRITREFAKYIDDQSIKKETPTN